MLIPILIGVVVIVAGFLVIVAMQPSTFCIKRSATIPAPASALFAEVNDFHQWKAWSPWAEMDRNAKNTFEGSSSGAGAIFKWEGNNQVGQGEMTILESHPCDLIRIKLTFLKPFQATHTVEFTFQPSGNQTVVTWSMSGRNNFMAKAVVLFMNCDKMIGGQYEKGLANLESVVVSAVAV